MIAHIPLSSQNSTEGPGFDSWVLGPVNCLDLVFLSKFIKESREPWEVLSMLPNLLKLEREGE